MTVQVEGLASAAAGSLPLQLRGRVLVAARVVWAALISLSLGLFVLSVPARYNQLSHPPADVRTQLAHAGLSAGLYAGYLTLLSVCSVLVYCAVAALIIRHRPADRIGLLASLFLTMGLGGPPQTQALVLAHPALAAPANLVMFLFILLLVTFFFVFPTGRIEPQWARLPVLMGAAASIGLFLVTGASVVGSPPDWNPAGWFAAMTIGGGLAGIAAQIYRYRRVSDRLERQQTKWVAFGVCGAMGISIVLAFVGSALPTIGRSETGSDLLSVTVNTLAFLCVPLAIGAAILRYRLWDIDVVINRTLVYGALTVGLLALYLLVVNGLDAVVRAGGRLPLSLLTTALIAVLFAPLRDRLQAAVNRLMYGDREDPYRVLTRLGERVGAALAPDEVLPAIAETVAQAMKSPHAAIVLHGPEGAQADVEGTALRLPIEYRGERVGELLVAPRGPGEQFSGADRRLLADLARQIGPAAHAVRLTADLQRSRERLVTAREEERRRLRRDLHDGLGPQLAALTLKIETIRNRFAHEAELDGALVDLTARTQVALAGIRRLVYGLRPPALDELGLLPALAQAAAQYGSPGDGALQVTLDAPASLPPLPAAVEVAAYRIVEEALTNVVRHAAARTCRVAVVWDEAAALLRLRIADDGRGLPAQTRSGVGLVSMRERAEELGGRCDLAPGQKGGTAVTVELPCRPVRAAPAG